MGIIITMKMGVEATEMNETPPGEHVSEGPKEGILGTSSLGAVVLN